MKLKVPTPMVTLSAAMVMPPLKLSEPPKLTVKSVMLTEGPKIWTAEPKARLRVLDGGAAEDEVVAVDGKAGDGLAVEVMGEMEPVMELAPTGTVMAADPMTMSFWVIGPFGS